MALGIVGLITLLTALGLSLFISKLAAIALMHTGLSAQAAQFQARSAFTGTGFTTREAESIVRHPVRRRIIMWLMVVRSAGLVTIVISLFLSFLGPSRLGRIGILIALVSGLGGIYLVSRSRFVDRLVHRFVRWALRHWTDLNVQDYASLLNLTGKYAVLEIRISKESWFTGRTVGECFLEREGVKLLGITRKDGTYLGVPGPDTEFLPDDTLVLYGRRKTLRKLDSRPGGAEGEAEHAEAVQEESDRAEAQEKADRAHRRKREDATVEEAETAAEGDDAADVEDIDGDIDGTDATDATGDAARRRNETNE
jgi:hypothetical protein